MSQTSYQTAPSHVNKGFKTNVIPNKEHNTQKKPLFQGATVGAAMYKAIHETITMYKNSLNLYTMHSMVQRDVSPPIRLRLQAAEL